MYCIEIHKGNKKIRNKRSSTLDNLLIDFGFKDNGNSSSIIYNS